MQIVEARPPYVTFEIVAEEDRAATIEKGHYVAKDVVYAWVTPQGSKDRIPRQVDDWFANLRQQVQQERFPAEWLRNFEAQYSAWKSGHEAPLVGTSIRQWPAVSPAQVSALLHAHIKTVEDLAAANEETLTRLGMGARALKQRALDWLASASNTGAQAERLAALAAENADLKARNAELDKRLSTLAAQVESMAKAQATQAPAAQKTPL